MEKGLVRAPADQRAAANPDFISSSGPPIDARSRCAASSSCFSPSWPRIARSAAIWPPRQPIDRQRIGLAVTAAFQRLGKNRFIWRGGGE